MKRMGRVVSCAGVVLGLVYCGQPTLMSRQSDNPADVASAPVAERLTVSVERVETGGVTLGRGALVVSWLTQAEAEQFRLRGALGPTSILPFVRNSRALRLEKQRLISPHTLELEVTAPADRAFAVAVLDRTESFWPTVMGASNQNWVGVAGEPAIGNRASVTLHPIGGSTNNGHRPAQPLCTGPRFRHIEAVGGTPPLCVCLPESYERTPSARFPVIYLLPGLSGNEFVRFQDPEFVTSIDTLSRRHKQEVILVGVSTEAPFGSVYFSPGVASRRFSSELARVVDSRFRTVLRARGRVLLGQSTGGFNAVTLALSGAEVFGSVVALSPDALDLEGWLLADDGMVRELWLAWMRLEDVTQGAGQMLSYAHSFGSGTEGWPVDLANGTPRQPALAAWLSHSPLRLLNSEHGTNALRQLEARLVLSVSREDEFGLFDPTQRFSARLDALGVAHEFRVEGTSHFDIKERLAAILNNVLRDLAGHQGA